MKFPKIFKSITFKKNNANLFSHNVVRDWFMILIVGLIIFILSAFLCWRLNLIMLKVSEDDSKIGEKDKNTVSVNRSAMNDLVDSYKNQESLFEFVKKSAVSKSDPSR